MEQSVQKTSRLGGSTTSRCRFHHRPPHPSWKPRKDGKSFIGDEVAQVVVGHRRHSSCNLLDISLPWREGVSTAYVPTTGGRLVSPRVASTIVGSNTICRIPRTIRKAQNPTPMPRATMPVVMLLVLSLSCRYHTPPARLMEMQACLVLPHRCPSSLVAPSSLTLSSPQPWCATSRARGTPWLMRQQ